MKLDIVVLWITFTTDRLSEMRKLTCHCGQIEIEIDIKDNFEDLYRCNCSMCIRKGAITAIVNQEDLKVVKGMEKLKCYQFKTKVAKHYFCSNCGIQTHNLRRRDPNTYGINVACINDISTKELFDFKVRINDGRNHIMDRQ